MLFTADGLVVKTFDTGNSDRIIELLTTDRGRISVMVKGARSKNSNSKSVTELFAYGNYEIYKKTDRLWLKSGSLNHSFFDITRSLEKTYLAVYLCELACELTYEGEDCSEMLSLLLNALYLLKEDTKSEALIKAVFEMKAMMLSGYEPNMKYCSRCKKPQDGLFYLDAVEGVLICPDCLNRYEADKQAEHQMNGSTGQGNTLFRVPISVSDAVEYISNSPIKRAFSFDLKDEGELSDLSVLSEIYTQNRIEKCLGSLNFLKSLTNNGRKTQTKKD